MRIDESPADVDAVEGFVERVLHLEAFFATFDASLLCNVVMGNERKTRGSQR